ncbi:MAG: DNA repair protein RecO [Nitrospirota bacterium]
MPLLSTEAIVLSSLRLGEDDKLITFFTLTRGKMSGVAKGARRFKNRFGASLEPFTQCHLLLFEKPNNKLSRISQSDILRSFWKLREGWEVIERGTQMVRLLLKITPEEQQHPGLYHLIKEALSFLEEGRDGHLSEILFMAHLISESGYQPRWDCCVRCDLPVVTDFSVQKIAAFFSYQEGGMLCPKCGAYSTDYPSGPRTSVSAASLSFLQMISKISFQAAHLHSPNLLIKREVETLLRDYITYLIGSNKRVGKREVLTLPSPRRGAGYAPGG